MECGSCREDLSGEEERDFVEQSAVLLIETEISILIGFQRRLFDPLCLLKV